MDAVAQSNAAIFGWTGIIVMMIVGFGLFFSRPTNMERPVMIGVLTIFGACVAGVLMKRAESLGIVTWFQVIGFIIIALAFFGWAWLLDYGLGPTPINREADEDTFGAHLSG